MSSTNQWECPECHHLFDMPDDTEDKYNPKDAETWVDCPRCGFPIL